MAAWKVHYFTENCFTNDNSNTIWFKSACNLAASGAPTKRSSVKHGPTTCKRCLNALKKKAK